MTARTMLARSIIRQLEATVISNEFCWRQNTAARAWREMRHRYQQEERTTNMADRDTKNPTPPPAPPPQ